MSTTRRRNFPSSTVLVRSFHRLTQMEMETCRTRAVIQEQKLSLLPSLHPVPFNACLIFSLNIYLHHHHPPRRPRRTGLPDRPLARVASPLDRHFLPDLSSSATVAIIKTIKCTAAKELLGIFARTSFLPELHIHRSAADPTFRRCLCIPSIWAACEILIVSFGCSHEKLSKFSNFSTTAVNCSLGKVKIRENLCRSKGAGSGEGKRQGELSMSTGIFFLFLLQQSHYRRAPNGLSQGSRQKVEGEKGGRRRTFFPDYAV